MFSALLAKEFVFEFLFLFGAASSLINVPHCLNAAIFSTSLACSSNGASDLLTQYGEEERVLQVDSDIAYFHPWTHEPVCTQFLESVGSELCIYTNASFSNGRGISIFTTPSIAEQFSKLLPFEDAAVLDGVNNPGGPWYTKELPGKGTGLIAGRELARGDLVTAYTPVLLVNKDRILSTRDRELLLRIAVDQLPSASRDAYLKLSTIFGNPAFIVQDVLKANNFEMQLGGEMHLALFPETSRMNHDCGPNSQYYLDASRLTHYVHAARPISAGEEITISYTNPVQSSADRQAYLQKAFHFTCACERCKASKETDAILDQIKSLEDELAQCDIGSTATVDDAEELIRLYKEQGLHGFMDTTYQLAAITYNSFGDVEAAKRHAKLKSEVVAIKDGPDVANSELWKLEMAYPKEHWSWNARMEY